MSHDDNLDLSLTLDVTEMPVEEIREKLDTIFDSLEIDPEDFDLSAPMLYSCIDCGNVVCTDSTLKTSGADPRFERHREDVSENLVALSDECQSCGANGWAFQEFGVSVNVK